MNKTSIAWCDRTWNPVRGCSRVSPGCAHCYAEKIAARFSAPGMAFHGFAQRGPARWTGKVELLDAEKLEEPIRVRKPSRIFVNSTSDLFHEALAFPDIAAVFGVMAYAHHHTFQVLTKRPARALAFFRWLDSQPLMDEHCHTVQTPPAVICLKCAAAVEGGGINTLFGLRLLSLAKPADDAPIVKDWPLPNVWLGVSVEDQKTADQRIPVLLQTPAALRFVSYEPALGPVSFNDISAPTGEQWDVLDREEAADAAAEGGCAGTVDWVIAGGESGADARPARLEWFRSVQTECEEAGTAFFMKQTGARLEWGRVGACGFANTARGFVAHGAGGAAGYDEILLRDRAGADPAEWPEDLRVQQFPKVSQWLGCSGASTSPGSRSSWPRAGSSTASTRATARRSAP